MRPTDISPTVRRIVLERDSIDGAPCCIYCGKPWNIELAHYISRGRMGKGIPENLVCLCTNCHRMLDQGSNSKRREQIGKYVKYYLETMYPYWDEADLVVKKDSWPKCEKDDCFANDRGSCTTLTESYAENCPFYKGANE